MKFHENPSSLSRVFPCGRIDISKLPVAFPNFANAPKKIVGKFRALHHAVIHPQTCLSGCVTYKLYFCVHFVWKPVFKQMPARRTDHHAVHCTGRLTPTELQFVSFPDSYPGATGCSTARLMARPTLDTQVVTRLCKSDIAKNVSFFLLHHWEKGERESETSMQYCL